MSTLLSIIVMLLMLAVLVSIHEAGHLIAAKIFGVYCFEYSIGFGPKILKVKRKKGETYFSIRCIPFGGYVSMYGEPESVPEGEEAPPPERSLENINRGKKAVILLAGVTMNMILGLVLIFISCSCFPQYYTFESRGVYEASAVIEDSEDPLTGNIYNYTLPGEYGEEVTASIESKAASGLQASDYYILNTLLPNEAGSSMCYLLDSSVVIYSASGEAYNDGNPYVAVYYPSELVSGHSLISSLRLYPADTTISVQESYPLYASFGVENWPSATAIDNSYYFHPSSNLEGYYFDLTLTYIPSSVEDETITSFNALYDNYAIKDVAVRYTINSSGEFEDAGVFIPSIHQYLSWNGAWSLWAERVPDATMAIIEGLGQLFTGHVENLSSIVGMTAAIPAIASTGGTALIFYYAGMISINLAIFNLLPIPPLDGWGLLVTIIEAISRKKVPDKVKGIVQLAGFALMFALLIFIVVKDIIALV